MSGKMCSVGDLKNNVKILQSEARQMRYTGEFDIEGLTKGHPCALLPLYNHLFTNYNPQFSSQVMELLDDNLYTKSDVRFIESVYKVLRDLFHFKPSVTKEQFFTLNGFAECKIIMCVEVMRLIQHHCRFLGPRNPTNPNIKVTSIIDTRRCTKKSSSEMVAEVGGVPNRKVSSEKFRSKPMSTLLGIGENGWQLKLGYLRPDQRKSNVDQREHRSYRECMDREESRKEGQQQQTGDRGEQRSPVPGRSRSEGGDMPQDKQKGQKEEIHSQSHPHSDWDPTGAVECILAKVRDLPTQLTSFIKAVENRLQKIEERMDQMESAVGGVRSLEGLTFSTDLKKEMDTVLARLLLMENRVTLLENKLPASGPPESVRTMTSLDEKRSADYTSCPFVSLERGGCRLPLLSEDFPGSLVNTFSPIRQDVGDFSPFTTNNHNHNHDIDTMASFADDDGDRRLSSTPNHSLNTRPLPPHSGAGSSSISSTGEAEKRAVAVSAANTTIGWDNLDSSTQLQVERIKDMLKATQVLLPTTVPQQQQGDT
ncbi:uncharacterized protein LOC143298963 isoform X2 [Babylonia areolata]|uniref:uncharacterized protein LOC143298963 isoform X2 n=1 Tax=Babylonia areolata TaxID=304850 RepID=UPI003FD265D8